MCDSKLKVGMHILLSALGGHAALVELDISGNNIGDTGAKMLAKALMTNTSLRCRTNTDSSLPSSWTQILVIVENFSPPLWLEEGNALCPSIGPFILRAS